MLYYFFLELKEFFSPFNVFRYLTFRAAYALVTALVLSFLLGPLLIRKLRQHKIGQTVRHDGPEAHSAKEGTPTMGGLLIVFCIIFPTLLWADLTNRAVQLVLFSTLWLGAIGFVDDYLKLVKKKSKGLVASEKLLGQTVLGLLLGIYLYVFPLEAGFATKTNVLFFKNFFVDFGWLYVPFVAVVVVASSNAVNLTDGLDGLAIGVVAFSAFAYLGMSYVVGNFRIAEYLNVLFIHSAGELTVFCATIVGAALGFLWFNSHPAEVFMGDTGSLALGGALGTVAVLIKQEVLLALVGGVFVIEALSVIVQVGYFKLSHGKRLLRMSPLHHHFELAGWSESKIVTRFWILAAICALLALSTLKIR